MQAIVELGGKQYRVSPDQVFYAELTEVPVGQDITLSNVLYIENNSQVKVGAPYITGAKVMAKILEEVKGPKLVGLFYRTKKHNHRKWGHRQKYHKLQITSISG